MVELPGGPIVAIIPARGGSKRIPRKNVKPFLGVPLIVRTLRNVLASGVFDRVVVSTDDEQVAQLAVEAGADVPFLRPAELAGDHIATRPVIAHAIEVLESDSSCAVGPVCCVYPAAVMISAQAFQDGLDILRTQGVDKVMTAVAFPAPVQRAWRRLASGEAEMVWPKFAGTRTQDLEVLYHDAGQFYWAWRATWLSGDRPSSVRMLELDRSATVDIDTPEDWETAELAFQIMTSRRQRR